MDGLPFYAFCDLTYIKAKDRSLSHMMTKAGAVTKEHPRFSSNSHTIPNIPDL